jgi:hypothetical protein
MPANRGVALAGRSRGGHGLAFSLLFGTVLDFLLMAVEAHYNARPATCTR